MNGQGFCCNDGTPEAAQARAMARTRAANDNFHDKDNYEKMQFFYHPDHLGSSSYITNLDGEVAQHIEYVPFGEVFIEERNNTWNTPYLFNAKEFDEETGMYYYGARYYEPKLSLWLSVDPISNYDPRNNENYLDGEHNNGVYNSYNFFPYEYCYQNPLHYIDPNGKQGFFGLNPPLLGASEPLLLSSKPIVSATRSTIKISSKSGRNINLERIKIGRQTEAEQLKRVGLDKNNKSFTRPDPKTGKEGTTIPDGYKDGQIVEIKNVKRLTDSKQLRLQKEISAENGRTPRLIINQSAKISKTVRQNFDIETYNNKFIIVPQDNTRVNKPMIVK